jgi:hypothetical protein
MRVRLVELLALALLAGCDLLVAYPVWELPPSTLDPDTRCDPAWWTGADLDEDGQIDLPHRALIGLDTPTVPVPTLPFTLEVDLPGWLNDLDTAGPFDPSVRVVLQDVDHEQAELPAQLVERLTRLNTREDHLDPDNDGVGLLAVLWDTDGDLGTAETAPAGASVCLAIYFSPRKDQPLRAPAAVGDLTVSADGPLVHLTAAGTLATLDADRGGLVTGLGLYGEDPIATQADQCCGNSMHFWSSETATGAPWGWVTPQSGPAEVEVIASGPLFAAVRSTGTREAAVEIGGEPVHYGAYTFDLLYWRFAHHPELWHEVTHTAVEDCTTEHQLDAALAFRPVQLEHSLGQTSALQRPDDTGPQLTAVLDATRGIALAVDKVPNAFAGLSNPLPRVDQPGFLEENLAVLGNEWIAAGDPNPATIAAGRAIFDHVGVILRPFSGPWAQVETEMNGLLQRYQTTAPCLESFDQPSCTAR